MLAKTKPERAEGAEINRLTERIIAAAIEIHRHLGPGLLESAYEECLCYELSLAGIRFARQVALPIQYKGLKLDCSYRMDMLVDDAVIVEIKSVDALLPIHSAQLLTYLKAANKRIGLLINFNAPMLKSGLKRIANRYTEPEREPAISASSAFDLGEECAPESLPSSLRFSPRLSVSAVNRRPR
jgi:GxxExxY protein